MADRHRTVQTQGHRRRSFELQEDERHHDLRRTVTCQGIRDRDSILYGCTPVDDRDRFEGFAVSADSEAETAERLGWTTLVNDYDSFKYLRTQERLFSQTRDAFKGCQGQIQVIEVELQTLRRDARGMKREFGSIAPEVIRRGQHLVDRLADLNDRLEQYRQLMDSAAENLRRLEADRRPDADATAIGDNGYNTTHWNLVFQWGQALIDRLGWQLPRLASPEIAKLIDQVKLKRSRMELTFPHYVELIGVLNAELYKRTGGANFLAKRNRMADLWRQHHLVDRRNTSTCPDLVAEVLFDPTERQFGDTRLDEDELLAAIDVRSAAARIANRHNVTLDEAVVMLTDEWN